MKAISFNDGWTYKHLDDSCPGVHVTLHHDAMLSAPPNELTVTDGRRTGKTVVGIQI